jgi:hypothetical protein
MVSIKRKPKGTFKTRVRLAPPPLILQTKGGELMENSYADIRDYVFEICLNDEMFDEIASTSERWEKFDTILDKVYEGTKDSLQDSFDEIFGAGAIVVL